jgi:Flp pilus assembly protein TadB
MLKRHYNKGYYVNHTKNKHAVTLAKEEKSANIILNKPLYSSPEQIEQPLLNTNKSQPQKVNDGLASANNIKANSKTKNEIKQSFKSKALTITKPLIQIKNKVKALNNLSADHDDHDGLSLFWIIILAIVILWALGFLVGNLGGAIHLLLVVALILFILWILGVV